MQHSKDFLEEVNSAVVRQTSMVTGNFDVSWQIWHVRELLPLCSQFAEPSAIQQMPIPLGQNTIAGHCLAPDRSLKELGDWDYRPAREMADADEDSPLA